VAWLIFLSARFGRSASTAPGVAVATMAIVFGVPAFALFALWVFFRIRHWIAHRPKRHHGARGK
jgi:hypothetical protein